MVQDPHLSKANSYPLFLHHLYPCRPIGVFDTRHSGWFAGDKDLGVTIRRLNGISIGTFAW